MLSSETPLKYTHLDVAGSSGELPGPTTASSVVALAMQFLKWSLLNSHMNRASFYIDWNHLIFFVFLFNQRKGLPRLGLNWILEAWIPWWYWSIYDVQFLCLKLSCGCAFKFMQTLIFWGFPQLYGKHLSHCYGSIFFLNWCTCLAHTDCLRSEAPDRKPWSNAVSSIPAMPAIFLPQFAKTTTHPQ